MTLVTKSRHTPNLPNAEGVGLTEGMRVKYVNRNGSVAEATIAGPYAQHSNGRTGWEALFDDTGRVEFADELRVIDWPDRVGAPIPPAAALEFFADHHPELA